MQLGECVESVSGNDFIGVAHPDVLTLQHKW